MKEYDFPVWGTNGGGLVRWVGNDGYTKGQYVFVESPKDFPNISIGDILPEEWNWALAPANKLAEREMDRY